MIALCLLIVASLAGTNAQLEGKYIGLIVWDVETSESY